MDSSCQIVFSLGGHLCRLFLDDVSNALVDQILRHYDGWRVPASPLVKESFSLRIQFELGAPESGSAPDKAHGLTVEDNAAFLRASRWDFRVHMSPAQRGPQGLWIGTAVCAPNFVSFDSLLRVVCAHLLPRWGGCLVQAAAVRVGQSGFLLAGANTDHLRLAHQLLAEDLAAVVPSDEGGWRLHSTPFWSGFRCGAGSLRSWPLRAIGFLHKGGETTVRALPVQESLARLLGCFVCFGQGSQVAAQALAVATTLVKKLPTFAASASASPDTLLTAFEHHGGAIDRPDLNVSMREEISQFRWMVNKHGHYGFRPRGHSMKPWIQDGQTVFVAPANTMSLTPGQVLVYWTPGASPSEDLLTCHRLISKLAAGTNRFRFYTKGDNASRISAFENGRNAQILGTVVRPCSAGAPMPLGSRASDVGLLLLSLGTMPLMRLLGR